MYILSAQCYQPILDESGVHADSLAQLQADVLDVDYSQFFEKNELRRLGNVIKHSVGNGLRALASVNVATPDAIITGTGKGSISKIEQFLIDIEKYQETALNPAVFIQSTHNTINGQLAIKTQCNGYNMTYVNQGRSLHNVLLDSENLLSERPESHILIGTFEENTDFNIQLYKNAGIDQSDEGHIGFSQGVAFFVVTGIPSGVAAEILVSHCFQFDATDDVEALVSAYRTDDTAFLIGNVESEFEQSFYANISGLSYDTPNFKTISGEYDTAGSFGLYYSAKFLIDGFDPLSWFNSNQIERVILVNHYRTEVIHVLVLQKSSTLD